MKSETREFLEKYLEQRRSYTHSEHDRALIAALEDVLKDGSDRRRLRQDARCAE